MKVYKFGGISIKDASSIKNISVLLKTLECKNTLMIVSAMGKTTNMLESIVQGYFSKHDTGESILQIARDHIKVASTLFINTHPIFQEIEDFLSGIKIFLQKNKSPVYNFVYDQIVSVGELISTKIVSSYLDLIGIENKWLDVREYIKTDVNYRHANVNWEETAKRIATLQRNVFYLTQGFIGSDLNGFTTTLGREGSDYTAAIFAWCLDADSQTIWKDVPGILNADPRYFSDTEILHQLSYEEAIELAYYGASVIHPKTLQPLQNKSIPLYVRSFLNNKQKGTLVKKGPILLPMIPCYILKKNQILLSFSSINFTLIDERNISDIFKSLAELVIKVNLMQSSATNFSICIEDGFNHLEELFIRYKNQYKICLNKGVSLYTLRHYTEESIAKISSKKNILLQQLTTNTAQWVVQE